MRGRPRLEVEHNGVHLWAELPWKCSAKKRERVAQELREMAERYSSTPEKVKELTECAEHLEITPNDLAKTMLAYNLNLEDWRKEQDEEEKVPFG